jgi:hypothetical protein
MSIREFKLNTKCAGAQALEGLWGPAVGDLLYDMSAKGRGRGNHCTRTGAGPRTQYDEERGHCLLFNGTDDTWSTERALGIGTAPFTLMAWVWSDSTTVQQWASWVASGDAGVGEWMVRIFNSHNALSCLRAYGDGGGIAPEGALGTFNALKDTWAHVAWNRTAAGVSNVYQNGLFVATDAAAADDLNTAKVMTIGSADAAVNRWFQGMIDDVRYYSRALSLAEISYVYDTTRGKPYADLIHRPTRPRTKKRMSRRAE